ncbi:hypothetical protein AMJ85_10475 [candidate division BRC1 bacterium SM23_51]|nr:MAG: hypothetical protein AMJ85_10475 [candidate division BRC1 bacterium SM23_51]
MIGVKYKAGDAKAAVPLGGIGTGTVYFTSHGTFEGNALANTYRPVAGPMEGCSFAVRAEAGGKTVTRLLQTKPVNDWPTVESLTYLGHYPFVDIEYLDEALPVEVRLRAMSPFILGDSRESATPGAMFQFAVANTSETTATASLAFSWAAPEPTPAQGLKSQGNVDGFLTWSLGTIPPHYLPYVQVVYGLASSEDAAVSHIRNLQQSWPDPFPLQDWRDWKATSGTVWLTNGVTDFAVDRLSCFNWEDEGRQALISPAGGCLSQHGFAIQYDDGEAKQAWALPVGKHRLKNLLVAKATRRDPTGRSAETNLVTTDGKLAISVLHTLRGGPLVFRLIQVVNLTNCPIENVRVSVYANLEADHTEPNDEAHLDGSTGAFLTVDSESGKTAFLAGPKPATAGRVGTWGSTIDRMADGRGLPIEKWDKTSALASRKATSGSTDGTWHWLVSESSRDRSGCTIGVLEQPGAAVSALGVAQSAVRRDWLPNKSDAMVLGTTVTLAPGEKRSIRFLLAWYYPDARDSAGNFVGHIYSNWFDSSLAVAQHLAENWHDLARRTGEWQEKVYRAPLPDWLKEELVNSLYSMARNTCWIADGRYTHSESFRGCPIMETIVCRFYGSIPLAMFFPDLEKNTMRQFIRHQREDGAIPFAFGRPEYWDRPYYETQQSLDSAEFALMAWRDYEWWDDRDWACEVYPAVKRAIRFAQTLDLDDDGVINDEVSMQYYDCWKFTGTSAYVGTIWLAALRAGEEFARMEGDAEFAAECRRWFEKARASLERDLWTGRYYRLYHDRRNGRKSDTSLGNQLVGQWYAYLCGLGEILPRDHILAALRHVAEKNGTSSSFGLVNGVTPDGRRDTTGTNGHSDSITIGETYCYAATCIYAGIGDLGLPFARQLAENIALRQRSPWNTTWNMNPDTGEMAWGTEYYSDMCVWDLWGALLGRRTLDP